MDDRFDADRCVKIHEELMAWLMAHFGQDAPHEIAGALSYELGRIIAGATRDEPAFGEKMIRQITKTLRQQVQAHHRRGVYDL